MRDDPLKYLPGGWDYSSIGGGLAYTQEGLSSIPVMANLGCQPDCIESTKIQAAGHSWKDFLDQKQEDPPSMWTAPSGGSWLKRIGKKHCSVPACPHLLLLASSSTLMAQHLFTVIRTYFLGLQHHWKSTAPGILQAFGATLALLIYPANGLSNHQTLSLPVQP